ncbi:MAG: hypothetical protein ACLFVO_29000 [Chloroflexaceae bacterium]
MPSIPHVTTAVETVLHELPDLSRAARQRLVFFVLGVLVAGTIVLRRVATTQSHIAVGTVQAASHERRLRRILNDPELRPAVPMDGRLVRRVLQRLWHADECPIVGARTQFDAPNWSTERWQAARPHADPVSLTERIGQREHVRKVA